MEVEDDNSDENMDVIVMPEDRQNQKVKQKVAQVTVQKTLEELRAQSWAFKTQIMKEQPPEQKFAGLKVLKQTPAPKDSAAFGLTFIVRAKISQYSYVGDGQYALIIVIDPEGLARKENMKSLERRPWSACFNKDESVLIVGEVQGIVQGFSLANPENPEKIWKIDFLELSPIKSKIDDDHALS